MLNSIELDIFALIIDWSSKRILINKTKIEISSWLEMIGNEIESETLLLGCFVDEKKFGRRLVVAVVTGGGVWDGRGAEGHNL